MATVPRVVTYEEWLAMPPREDGAREEVVDGEVQVVTPPQLLHALVIQRLISRLIRQVDEARVSVIGSAFGLIIREDILTCRQPDLAMCWIDRWVVRDGMLWSAPELVVEVISPSETRRRKQAKMSDYARIGVPEAWIVSPEAQSVEIRLLKGGELRVEKIIVEGELRPTQFPDVAVPVGELWPE